LTNIPLNRAGGRVFPMMPYSALPMMVEEAMEVSGEFGWVVVE
jgi:hypothetical protein